jgi:hypothetical protein
VANVAMVWHRAVESTADDQDPAFLLNPRFLVFWFKKNALGPLGDPQSTSGDQPQTATYG